MTLHTGQITSMRSQTWFDNVGWGVIPRRFAYGLILRQRRTTTWGLAMKIGITVFILRDFLS